MAHDQIERVVGALRQQHLPLIHMNAALAQHVRDGRAQWQIAPGRAVATLNLAHAV